MSALFIRNKWAAGMILVALFCVAFGKIHLRVRAVVVGYEIGKLKGRESELLERRSLLRMQVAQLTSRRHLEQISDSQDFGASTGRLASK